MLTNVNVDDAVSRGSIDGRGEERRIKRGGGIKKAGIFSSTFYR